MGVSIHGSAYPLQSLLDQMDDFVIRNGGYRENALSPEGFLRTVVDDFGILLDDHFVTVCNEYYEDYNPEYNFTAAVQRYYFPEKDWDECDYGDEFYPKDDKYFGGGGNAEEVLSEKFESEFGYEGKYSE